MLQLRLSVNANPKKLKFNYFRIFVSLQEKLNFVVDARRMLNEIAEKLPNYTIQRSKKRPVS